MGTGLSSYLRLDQISSISRAILLTWSVNAASSVRKATNSFVAGELVEAWAAGLGSLAGASPAAGALSRRLFGALRPSRAAISRPAMEVTS